VQLFLSPLSSHVADESVGAKVSEGETLLFSL
jgi:hypothetical protein